MIYCNCVGSHCRRWTWSNGTMIPEQLYMLQLQKVKHIFTEWSQTVASKPWPWTSASTLSSEYSIALYLRCLCCLQDMQRPCASSWTHAKWTQYPKTGELTFAGMYKRSECLHQHRFPCYRWGNTPLDEAMHFCHHDVVDILRRRQDMCSPPAADDSQQTGGGKLGTFF